MSRQTSSAAKERWQILKRALLRKEKHEDDDRLQYSVRRHNTFSLFNIRQMPHLVGIEETDNFMWYEYNFPENCGQYVESVVVRKNLEKLSTEVAIHHTNDIISLRFSIMIINHVLLFF